MLQRDLNFVGTIKRALEQNSIKSLMVMLDYIFDKINTPEYQELIMHDLPHVIKSPKLNINEFFGRSQAENFIGTNNFCNMENEFTDMQLPVFSELQTEYILMQQFENPQNVQQELARRII